MSRHEIGEMRNGDDDFRHYVEGRGLHAGDMVWVALRGMMNQVVKARYEIAHGPEGKKWGVWYYVTNAGNDTMRVAPTDVVSWEIFGDVFSEADAANPCNEGACTLPPEDVSPTKDEGFPWNTWETLSEKDKAAVREVFCEKCHHMQPKMLDDVAGSALMALLVGNVPPMFCTCGRNTTIVALKMAEMCFRNAERALEDPALNDATPEELQRLLSPKMTELLNNKVALSNKIEDVVTRMNLTKTKQRERMAHALSGEWGAAVKRRAEKENRCSGDIGVSDVHLGSFRLMRCTGCGEIHKWCLSCFSVQDRKPVPNGFEGEPPETEGSVLKRCPIIGRVWLQVMP